MRVPVYDIKNCGPRHRFVANGKLVHNSDSVNMQNLPRKSPIKTAIEAPEGYLFCDCDSSQIEARTLAWIAGQQDLVEFFEKNNDEIANGVPKEEMQFDPYKIMASMIYKKPVDTISGEHRQVGKVTILGCFAPDTLVLTARGWVPIVEVQATDTVWDGEAWVAHQGVIPQGEKDVIRAWGVAATPDHEILTEHGWREWHEVATDPFRFQSAIRKASSPFSAGTDGRVGEGVGNTSPEWSALVGGWAMWTDTTTSPGVLPGAIRAPKKRRSVRASSTGGTPTSYQTFATENGYSTGYRPASHDVTLPEVTLSTSITGIGVSECMLHGARIGEPSWPISSSYRGGTTPSCSLIAQTTQKGMNPATCASSPERPIWLTGEPSPPCRQKSMTYDIACAGPRNRYTIATNAGPIIVHNCGYGLGWRKFVDYSKQQGVDADDQFAKRIINTYREAYPAIPRLWEDGDDALEALIDGYSAPLGRAGVLQVGDTTQPVPSIKLPNGLYLRYPNLRRVVNKETGRTGIAYDTKRGASVLSKNIWGGSLTENFTQALARIIVGEQLLRVSKRYRVVMTVHDSVGSLIPEGEAKEGRTYVENCMRIRPKWAVGLPLNCESKIGPSYG